MTSRQGPSKHISLEEIKLAEKNKALSKKNSTSPSKQSPWSIRSLLFCCEQTEQDEVSNPQVGGKKTPSMAVTNHYSHGETSSFLRKSNRVLINANSSFYPTEALFLLGRGTKKIMCKIVRVNLVKKPQNIKSDIKSSQTSDGSHHKGTLADFGEIIVETGETYNFTRQEIFSLYSKGIQVDKSDWSEVTPECISEHIAMRSSGKFVIDALSGYGGNAIQFAKHCHHVIGIETESHKIKKADHNARIYGVNNMIDLIHADYFTLKHLKADVVFLAPSELPLEKNEKFSIFKHLSPNLPNLIRHSLTVAESLCILLPAKTNIEEIAAIFCDIYEENSEKYNRLNYSIQIEMLHLEDTLVAIVVHFGNDSMVNVDEKRELLLDTIDLNQSHGWRNSYSEAFVSRIFRYIGFHRSLGIILQIEEDFFRANVYEESIFEEFLRRIEQKKLITPELLQQLLQKDKESRAQSSVKSTQFMGKLLIPAGQSGAGDTLLELDTHGSVQNSPLRRVPANGFSTHNTLKLDGIRELSVAGGSIMYNSNNDQQSTLKTPTKIEEVEFKDVSGTSFQSSDMAVSSYSMKSDAMMMDSYSDFDAHYTLSVEDDQPEIRKNSGASSKTRNSFVKVKKPQKKDRASGLF